MVPRFFAKFEYGRARLARVFAKSETEKVIKYSHHIDVIDRWSYFPDNIRKSEYNIFPDAQSALAFLIQKAKEYRQSIEKQLTEANKQVSDLMEMTQKIKEGEANDQT